MGNNFKDINIKDRTYHFFDNMINIKNLVPNKIKVNKKSDKNILIYYTGYVTVNNVNQEEISGNKCLVLVPTDKSKGIMEKYKKLWTKIRDLIRLKTDNSDNMMKNI